MGDEAKPPEKTTPDKLPGNHGQFGTNRATEAYQPLPNQGDPGGATGPGTAPPSAEGDDGNAGPKQVQGGMRS